MLEGLELTCELMAGGTSLITAVLTAAGLRWYWGGRPDSDPPPS